MLTNCTDYNYCLYGYKFAPSDVDAMLKETLIQQQDFLKNNLYLETDDIITEGT
tara:strand:+ start:227 stop:388 length:162 start_codon:yes stop_codon:yes gene_type:complete